MLIFMQLVAQIHLPLELFLYGNIFLSKIVSHI